MTSPSPASPTLDSSTYRPALCYRHCLPHQAAVSFKQVEVKSLSSLCLPKTFLQETELPLVGSV